jgi:glutathione S-transferase
VVRKPDLSLLTRDSPLAETPHSAAVATDDDGRRNPPTPPRPLSWSRTRRAPKPFKPSSPRSLTTSTQQYSPKKQPTNHPLNKTRYAEELGLGPDALTIKNLDMKEKREHKDPDYIKNIHVFGQVPALTVADKAGPDGKTPFALMESGAQLSYLAETHGQLPTPEARAVAAQWILFANSTFAQGIFFEGPRARALPNILASLDAFLGERGPYLAGAEFSVSDVAVGAYLHYADRFVGDQVDITPYKNLSAYKERVLSRPAAKKTLLA